MVNYHVAVSFQIKYFILDVSSLEIQYVLKEGENFMLQGN